MASRRRIFGFVYRAIQVLWLGLSIAVLVIYLQTRANATDADVFLGYAMITLSFPSGSIVLAVLTWIGNLVNFQVGSIWMWSEMLIVGYVQWFVLLPFAIRLVRRRISASAKSWAGGPRLPL